MCDTFVSVTERCVFFAKNSDRDPNEGQLVEFHPARRHAAGETTMCTYVAVPAARETHAIVISRPFWMWGAEMGVNEHGVAIGNEAVFTRARGRRARVGLTGMDLVRLGLERAATAKAACEILAGLVETLGQGGGAGYEDPEFTYDNSFLIADPDEAWVLETAGKRWARACVTRGVRSISNALTIPGFRERHRDRLRERVGAGATRKRRTELLAGEVRAVGDLFSVLRDHGGDAPRYDLLRGGLGAPCVHAGGLIASAQTTASLAASLSHRGLEVFVTGTAAPCTSVFKPIEVTRPIALGVAPAGALDASRFWRHERFHRRVTWDYARAMTLFRDERDALEREILEGRLGSEEAFARAAAATSTWMERVQAMVSKDTRPFWARRYWSRRDARAGLSTGS